MIDYELEGRVAIVTGGSTGIGFASAKLLAQQGVNTLLVSRSSEKLKTASDLLLATSSADIETMAGDVVEHDLANRAIDFVRKRWGKLDILINNAGGPPMGGFLEQNESTWQRALEQSLKSVIRFTTAAAPLMIEQSWGRIININTTLSKEPTASMVLSATARAGVLAFSKAISNELAAHGITVNTVCPGGVLTDRLKQLVTDIAERKQLSYDEALTDSHSTIPLGRFATPEEFADMVLFLSSERGRYITGSTMVVDGGLTKGLF